MRRILPIVIGLLLTAGAVHGQVARLSRPGTGLLDIDALVEYIKANSPLNRGRASRVTIK